MARPATGQPRGQTAVVIGGGGAIGRACVKALAASGARIWSLDYDGKAAEAALAGLGKGHRHAVCDVTDPAALKSLAREMGPADSVIYAAGLNADGLVVDTDWSTYRRVMAVNLDGAFHAGAAFAGAMIEAGRPGAFAFLSSAAGLRGEAGAAIYCASKFGLIGFVESFAAELTPHDIRVNAVCPGNVDSPMLRDVARGIAARVGSSEAEIYQSMERTGAAQRLLRPDEIASLLVYLVSPASSGITGTSVRIDGGAMLSA